MDALPVVALLAAGVGATVAWRMLVIVPQRTAFVVERLGRSRAATLSAPATPDLAQAAEPWGLTVLRHEITHISRHRKESHA